MATEKTTTIDDTEKIRGAKAAIAALTALEGMGMATNKPDLTWPQFWESNQDAAKFLVGACRVEGPFLVGFMSTIAEYVMNIGTGNIRNITAGDGPWEPIAAMSGSEFEARNREYEEELAI